MKAAKDKLIHSMALSGLGLGLLWRLQSVQDSSELLCGGILSQPHLMAILIVRTAQSFSLCVCSEPTTHQNSIYFNLY